MLHLQIAFVLALVCGSFAHVGNWAVFSTKTAYHWAHPMKEPAVDAEYEKTEDNSTCKAAHVYMVLRHGSRYPSDGSTEVIALLRQQLLEAVNGTYYQDVLAWKSNYTLDMASELAPLGKKEQYKIGRRVLMKLKTLFQNNGAYVKFVSSTKNRNTDSSISFYEGLNSTDVEIGAFVNEINGTLTHYYDDCANYEKFVTDNETHMQEFTKYADTADFTSIKENLTALLGLNYTFSADEVYVIFELCSYDKYIYNTSSFWCNLLSDEDRKVLEYGQDLEAYYEESYTHPIIPKMTCPLIGDIFHTIDRAINDTWDYENLPADAAEQGYLAGKFLDGHSTTIVTLMTTLGLFKDDQPLLATNREEMVNRQFKTSIIAPYSTNVGFILYACQTEDGADKNMFKVQLLVDETPMLLPGCDSLLCPYEQVRNSYSDLINNCNMTEICD